MKCVTIVGARPQFVKAAPVSQAIRRHHREVLVHTGQHYDSGMSEVFFRELAIPAPDVNLGIGSGTHGRQTGEMLEKIEGVLLSERPDFVLIYGDTNSTLAGALAASKLHVPVAHVEAGLRSYNRRMPEEINRVVADHLSAFLFCPSETAVGNLAGEGITSGVHLVGDVMAAALHSAVERAGTRHEVLEAYGLRPGAFLLATLHRAENTDDESRLRAVIDAFSTVRETVILPLHPRTRKMLAQYGVALGPNVLAVNPVGYLDMVVLERSARMILTDSGGIQKEAYWLGVPCVTLRDETEWTETVSAGWNLLVGASTEKIVTAVRSFAPPTSRPPLYGTPEVPDTIVRILSDSY